MGDGDEMVVRMAKIFFSLPSRLHQKFVDLSSLVGISGEQVTFVLMPQSQQPITTGVTARGDASSHMTHPLPPPLSPVPLFESGADDRIDRALLSSLRNSPHKNYIPRITTLGRVRQRPIRHTPRIHTMWFHLFLPESERPAEQKVSFGIHVDKNWARPVYESAVASSHRLGSPPSKSPLWSEKKQQQQRAPSSFSVCSRLGLKYSALWIRISPHCDYVVVFMACDARWNSCECHFFEIVLCSSGAHHKSRRSLVLK